LNNSTEETITRPIPTEKNYAFFFQHQ